MRMGRSPAQGHPETDTAGQLDPHLTKEITGGRVLDTSAPVLGIHHTHEGNMNKLTTHTHTTMCRVAEVQNNQVLSHMRTTLNETPQTGELSHGA